MKVVKSTHSLTSSFLFRVLSDDLIFVPHDFAPQFDSRCVSNHISHLCDEAVADCAKETNFSFKSLFHLTYNYS